MKRKIGLIWLFLSFNLIVFAQKTTVIELKSGWKFAKGENSKANETIFNDAKRQSVPVPYN